MLNHILSQNRRFYLKQWINNWPLLLFYSVLLWALTAPQLSFGIPLGISWGLAGLIALRHGEAWLFRKLYRLQCYVTLSLVVFFLNFSYTLSFLSWLNDQKYLTQVFTPITIVGINVFTGWLLMRLCRGIRCIRRQRQRRKRYG